MSKPILFLTALIENLCGIAGRIHYLFGKHRVAANDRNAATNFENAIQEHGSTLAWLTFHAIAVYASISYWLRFKRICAWHQPKPIRMGGNPFARRTTHGICPECFARTSAEILSHQ